jgi:hypothetical protein
MRPVRAPLVPENPGSSATNNRPFSSNAIATGAFTNDSPATNSILKPGLIRNDEIAAAPGRGGGGGGVTAGFVAAGGVLVATLFVALTLCAAPTRATPIVPVISAKMETEVRNRPL